MKIKKFKIKAEGVKPYVAMFRKDNGVLHMILNQDNVEDNEEITYDDDQYEIVRAKTLEEMLTGGKSIDAKRMRQLKNATPEHWDDAWDEL